MMRLATICARAGSKRLPGKNTRILHGWPLWLWTLEQVIVSECFDFIVISSDDEAVGERWCLQSNVDGNFKVIRIKRPEELAGDDVGKVPAIRHALVRTEELTGHTFDQIVDLDVTAPLRTLDDIRGFCAKLDSIGHGGLVSATPSRRSAYFNMVECRSDGTATMVKRLSAEDFLRSQDVPLSWDLNASMTGWSRAYLMDGTDHPVSWNTHIYEMPPERSWDIDTQFDLDIVEFLMNKQRESAAA